MEKENKYAKIYEIWKNNLLAFIEDTLDHHLTSRVPDFHKEIYGFLPKNNRICIAAPRGFAKSRIVSVFYVLWSALFQHKKDICIISASEGLAIEWLRMIRLELENNSLLIKCFGYQKSEKWTENHIILKNGCNIRARGAGGQIRGFRPDLIILDDIETDESVVSEEQRRKMRDWIFRACINTLLPHGQLIWIGTIISNLALIQEMLTEDNGWFKRRYQAYIDGVQEKGFELWGDLWSHEKLQARKREIGSFAFASEYMNNPMSDEAAPIKKRHIRYWEQLPSDLTCVMTIDPAYSDDAKADYKVAVVVGADTRNNRYLVEYIRTHKPMGQFIEMFLNLYMKHHGHITALGVPDSGTEKEFYRSVVNRINEKQLPISVTSLKNVFKTGTDKSIRRKKDRIIAALQPLFEQGRYFIHKTHKEAEGELLEIGASRWDDIVDAMTYAESIVTTGFIDNTPTVDRYGRPIRVKYEENYGV